MDTLIGRVPDSWRTTRLDACCQLQPGPAGTTLKAADHVIGGVPVVTAKDIGNRRVSPAPGVSVTARTAERLRRYQLVEGDILLVRIGDTTRHAEVAAAQGGWLMGGSCIRVRAYTDVTPAYLSCYLTHPSVREWLAQHTRRGVLPTISAGTVATLPLVLPPANVQQTVIDVVRAVDHKIQVHEDIVLTTRALRNLLLPHLLSGDLPAAE
jgi:hypothetical protein